MKTPRAAFRLCILAGIIVWSLLTGLICRTPLQRARWMQRLSRRVLWLMNAEVTVAGQIPESGLIASNHLGYLDVLVIGSTLPAIFVAKSDVRAWPIIGPLCRIAGTVFVERERRSSARASLASLRSALDADLPVVLFPEGTSSDGATVLPLKSSLLQASEDHPVAAAALAYELPGGSAKEELCYWRDMVFAPHFWNVLGQRGFAVTVHFGRRQPPVADRKVAAARLREDMLSLLGA